MDLGLNGKSALITGVSKGLGKAMADELAREGADVSICARGKEDLEKATGDLCAHGVRVVATQADVTREADVRRVVDEAEGGCGDD